MKITLVNHSDTLGGASVVTFRLMEALRAEGVDARMLVAKKNSDSPYVEEAAASWRFKIPFFAEHLKIFTHNGFSKERLFQVSIATDGLRLSKHRLIKDSDAVILNWVNQGMLSLKEIGKIAGMKPTFWTMHDQWNFTGICHHTGNCERFKSHCCDCPFLGYMASGHDLSYKTFQRKKNLYAFKDITFIAVSDWLAARAGSSALLSGQKVASIPNAFPVKTYCATPKYDRAALGLPEGKKIILFAAARIDDPGKGLMDAVELLNGIVDNFSDSAIAVFVGALRDPNALVGLRFPHIHLGLVNDKERMRSLMKHSTIVISTSPFETLSTTMIEAQAAGATPVCYIHDGRGDIVTDGVTGYSITSPSDPTPLIKALNHPISKEVLLEAANRYEASSIARQYIRLIGDLRQA